MYTLYQILNEAFIPKQTKEQHMLTEAKARVLIKNVKMSN